MKKFLFLDFDGVLVADDFISKLKSLGEDFNDEFGMRFSNDCVKQLQFIVEETGAKIVVASSWKEYGMEFLNELWSERKMPAEIFSITPSLLTTSYLNQIDGGSFRLPERYSKGLEINAWLEMNVEGDYNYCILDDECFLLAEQLPHHVQPDSANGLTAEIAKNVIEILNCE